MPAFRTEGWLARGASAGPESQMPPLAQQAFSGPIRKISIKPDPGLPPSRFRLYCSRSLPAAKEPLPLDDAGVQDPVRGLRRPIVSDEDVTRDLFDPKEGRPLFRGSPGVQFIDAIYRKHQNKEFDLYSDVR